MLGHQVLEILCCALHAGLVGHIGGVESHYGDMLHPE